MDLRKEKLMEAMKRHRAQLGNKCRFEEVLSDFSNLASWLTGSCFFSTGCTVHMLSCHLLIRL